MISSVVVDDWCRLSHHAAEAAMLAWKDSKNQMQYSKTLQSEAISQRDKMIILGVFKDAR